ncbi:hypothetical protein RJZ56_000446 [Blastomyces dermatitidis]|uniref:Uncharacterized protein n=3 Tax=Blastomyces TaxID=229219 RepID=A0A179UFA7_BLAGS|nr:uncharacterized protein BDBG_02162 [Blastomyces gilchristii SLH14081]XP_045275447.1 uncharacterized protein BDCG_03405 [Blastomyces dermatitidis ER-3]EEQ88285.1 hypothetical protein BDCG_03405 [Blastomyces dermatitidis ER-3]EGE77553.1 hypothetical protein BDDG_00490 [Blastomyces dermatitidis ATCC 18188]OAT05837.1 hypothetical protein BDBG_02162 [Blastomyces gilchristii SLH14081]
MFEIKPTKRPSEHNSEVPPSKSPTKYLQLYTRLYPGHKALLAPSDTEPAQYFVVNKVPHKHASQWVPVFCRGDNPKYTPETTVIGRARRTAMWTSFKVWLGDGVSEILKNKDRRRKAKSYARKEKLRKFFCRGSKPPKEPLKDEEPVSGKVILVRMHRSGLSRKVEFEIEGTRYRWSGTRRFATGFMKGVKGWSHCLKLIRTSDHALIATFEKRRSAHYHRSIKTGQPPNKKKLFIGALRVYEEAYELPIGDNNGVGGSSVAAFTRRVDALASNPHSRAKDEKDLNPDGPHVGNLTEDMIMLSCWIVAEAEHRLRYKIFDVLQEIGENAGG